MKKQCILAIIALGLTFIATGIISAGEVTIKGDMNSDYQINLTDTVLALKVCAGISASVNKDNDVNSDGRIGVEEALYTLQSIAGLIDAEVFILQVTDVKTDVGFIITESTKRESLSISGEKDSNGNLISVNSVRLTSIGGNNSITLNINTNGLPESADFSDGNRAEFSNYSDKTVNVTVYDSAGSVIYGPALEELKEPIPQIPTPEQLCNCITSQQNSLEWLKNVLLAVKGINCVLSILSIPATGLSTLPLAAIGCGSFLVELREKMTGEEATPVGKVITNIDNILSKIFCITGELNSCVEEAANYIADNWGDVPSTTCASLCKPSLTCNIDNIIPCKGTGTLNISYSNMKVTKLQINGPAYAGLFFTYNISGDSENNEVNLTIVHKEAWVFHNGCYDDPEDSVDVVAYDTNGKQLDLTQCDIILESCPGADSTSLPCYWRIQ